MSKGLPRNKIKNDDWRRSLASVEQDLQQIRQIYEASVRQGATRIFEYQGHYYMPDRDRTNGLKIDQLRLSALDTLNRVCREVGVDTITTVDRRAKDSVAL